MIEWFLSSILRSNFEKIVCAFCGHYFRGVGIRLSRSGSDSEALGDRLLRLNADDAIDELAVLEDE